MVSPYYHLQFPVLHDTQYQNHVSSPPNFRGDLKFSYQNNWEGPEQKNKFGGGELNFRGGAYEPQ